MNTQHQLQFSVPPPPPPPPRFNSKRTIHAEREAVLENTPPFLEPKRARFISDKKISLAERSPPLDKDTPLVRVPESEALGSGLFGPSSGRRLRPENSWLERGSSRRMPWAFPESERKLGCPPLEPEPPAPARIRTTHYFSSRSLARSKAEGDGRCFRLETLKDPWPGEFPVRSGSMRLICKRGFEQFSGRTLGGRAIDTAFRQISFKSRESFSRVRGEESRGRDFSPFPLSRIDCDQAEESRVEEDFLDQLGTGAFKKFASRDPMTKAGTKSDARALIGSATLSPMEYTRGCAGVGKLRGPSFAELSRHAQAANSLDPLGMTLTVPLKLKSTLDGKFNSQRKIRPRFLGPGQGSGSWRSLARPWSAKQIPTQRSQRAIGNERDLSRMEKSGAKTEPRENATFIVSKRDFLEIETKYIGQEGEDKSAIEENPREREDLSIEDGEGPRELLLFHDEKGKKSAPAEAPGNATSLEKGKAKGETEKISVQNFQILNSQDKESKIPNQSDERKKEKEKAQPVHLENEMFGKKESQAPVLASKPFALEPELKSQFISQSDLKNESEKRKKICSNLAEALQTFDEQCEFEKFHNLLGLLSCLFVSGNVEDRYLSLSAEERGILAAIVYRKFKKTLNPR